jgi:hypothetical protein
MPGVRSVDVAMRELTFADDLRRVEISGLELTAARALRVHLRAGSARITGLAPWSRSPRLGQLARFAILVALGAALWLAASLGFRLKPPDPVSTAPAPRRFRGALLRLVFALPGALVAACVIALDQEQALAWSYGLAALAGIAGLLVLLVLARRAPKFLGSFSGF